MAWFVGLVFALHLLCVNVAAAGPLVAIAFDWQEGRGNRLAGEAGRYLLGWALALFVPGMALGAVVGWLLWSPTYLEVVRRLPSKIHFGVWELLFSLVLVAVQFLWWRKRPACGSGERAARIFVALLASSNLLYHFPILFAVIERLETSASPSGDIIDAAEFRTLLVEPQIVARAVHFVLAAIATCGVVLMGYSLRIARRRKDAEAAQRVAVSGARIALVPTLLQIPVGLWLVGTLPPRLQAAVMGSDAVTSLLFIVSLGLAIWMMQVLVHVAVGDADRAKLVRSMMLLVTTVALMSVVLQRLRAEAWHAARRETTSLVPSEPLPRLE